MSTYQRAEIVLSRKARMNVFRELGGHERSIVAFNRTSFISEHSAYNIHSLAGI